MAQNILNDNGGCQQKKGRCPYFPLGPGGNVALYAGGGGNMYLKTYDQTPDSHSHGISQDGSWRPVYLDVIAVTKNA